jgi:hypothetical protein
MPSPLFPVGRRAPRDTPPGRGPGRFGARRTALAGALVATAALALAASGAAGASTSTTAPAGSSAAAAQWKLAVANAGKQQSVAFRISQTGTTSSTMVVGRAGVNSGTAVITAKSGSTTGTVTENLKNKTVYFTGNLAGYEHVLQLPSVMTKLATGKWVTVGSGGSSEQRQAYTALANGLTLSTLLKNFSMSGPYTFGPKGSVGGKTTIAIMGYAGGTAGSSAVRQTFTVTVGSTSLPVAELATGEQNGTVVTQKATFRWNVPLSVSTPTDTVSFSTLSAAESAASAKSG